METFRFKKFEVKQAEGVFKVGTDACLLGSMVNLDVSDTILEIGSGTGVISLMLAQRSDEATIQSIDINSSAVNLTKLNFESSPWSSKLFMSQFSFNDMTENTFGTFDLIISNPPFFKDSLKNPEEHKSIARHEGELNLTNLIEQSKLIMSDAGRTALILPIHRRQEFKSLLSKNELNEIRIVKIRAKQSKEPNRFISEFSRSSDICLTENLILYNDDNTLTSAAKRLLEPFYLNL